MPQRSVPPSPNNSKLVASVVKAVRYDAAGNVYAVMAEGSLTHHADRVARELCRDGATDGLLVDEGLDALGRHRFRVFNPDGSEAEISGNGARIFAKYLLDQGRVVTNTAFVSATPSREVRCTMTSTSTATIDMGKVCIAREGDPREELMLGGATHTLVRADAGNPHAVVLLDEAISHEQVLRTGPQIEMASVFPERTNVQFCWRDPVDAAVVHARIWERGAGWTASSGSSACAVAAVIRRLARQAGEPPLDTWYVRMPGGELTVTFRNDEATLRGPVQRLED